MNGINYNKFRTFFNGKSQNTEQSKGTTVTSNLNDEALNSMTKTSLTLLHERSEREVPENGNFTLVGAIFNIPSSDNQALLSVGHDETDPKTQRLFRVGVRHKHSDKITSHILKSGTKQEILDYLKNPENIEAVKKSVLELSEFVDNNH